MCSKDVDVLANMEIKKKPNKVWVKKEGVSFAIKFVFFYLVAPEKAKPSLVPWSGTGPTIRGGLTVKRPSGASPNEAASRAEHALLGRQVPFRRGPCRRRRELLQGTCGKPSEEAQGGSNNGPSPNTGPPTAGPKRPSK